MSPESSRLRQRMRTPRAAAIAGIVFSVLLMASLLLIWASIPASPLEPQPDFVAQSRRLSLALDLLPFAGIAFLWFVGVLRDRMGDLEDRFFATVFLGSAILFLAMIFTGAAVAGGIVRVLIGEGSGTLVGSPTYALARIQIHQTMNTYASKMAGVFMMSTATISLRTRIVPRWMALLGYALALALLLLSAGPARWIALGFPIWVLLLSLYILLDNLRGRSPAAP